MNSDNQKIRTIGLWPQKSSSRLIKPPHSPSRPSTSPDPPPTIPPWANKVEKICHHLILWYEWEFLKNVNWAKVTARQNSNLYWHEMRCELLFREKNNLFLISKTNSIDFRPSNDCWKKILCDFFCWKLLKQKFHWKKDKTGSTKMGSTSILLRSARVWAWAGATLPRVTPPALSRTCRWENRGEWLFRT